MSPDPAELLLALRQVLADIESDVFGFQEKDWVLLDMEEQDINHIFVQRLMLRHKRVQALIDKHDPDGSTVLV